jgi:hypothetical protein
MGIGSQPAPAKAKFNGRSWATMLRQKIRTAVHPTVLSILKVDVMSPQMREYGRRKSKTAMGIRAIATKLAVSMETVAS